MPRRDRALLLTAVLLAAAGGGVAASQPAERDAGIYAPKIPPQSPPLRV